MGPYNCIWHSGPPKVPKSKGLDPYLAVFGVYKRFVEWSWMVGDRFLRASRRVSTKE